MADGPVGVLFRVQHAGTGALVNVYTASGSGTIISSIVFAGQAPGVNATARVRIAPGGAADAAVHEVFPAFTVGSGEHRSFTEGLTLEAGDVVRVQASAGVNVHLYGTELV